MTEPRAEPSAGKPEGKQSFRTWCRGLGRTGEAAGPGESKVSAGLERRVVPVVPKRVSDAKQGWS